MATEEKLLYWNFVTKRIDRLDSMPEDWVPYIPQTVRVQSQYAQSIRGGQTPTQAALAILKMCFG